MIVTIQACQYLMWWKFCLTYLYILKFLEVFGVSWRKQNVFKIEFKCHVQCPGHYKQQQMAILDLFNEFQIMNHI
jgi:hypothetical protein